MLIANTSRTRLHPHTHQPEQAQRQGQDRTRHCDFALPIKVNVVNGTRKLSARRDNSPGYTISVPLRLITTQVITSSGRSRDITTYLSTNGSIGCVGCISIDGGTTRQGLARICPCNMKISKSIISTLTTSRYFIL